MLQARLHGKVRAEFEGDPFAIEDVLTSVVVGACQYVEPEQGLLPFLRRALPIGTAPLADQLHDVDRVEFVFWPFWRDASVRASGATEEIDYLDVVLPGSEPDVLIKLHRSGWQGWLVLEAKLYSGKSSLPSTDVGVVQDQLAKYWMHLRRLADEAGVEALGIVYCTADLTAPTGVIKQSQKELSDGGLEPGRFHWLSWRWFEDAVMTAGVAPLLLQDVVHLLKHRYQLVDLRFDAWPDQPDAGGRWCFGWDWAHADVVVAAESHWRFTE